LNFLTKKGGISKAIVKSAGPSIRSDFDAYLRTHGSLELGKICVTNAYNLTNHKFILNVRSPSFHKRYTLHNNQLSSQTELVYAAILDKAFGELGLASLAIPLIGTGLAGIPVDESVNDLLEAVLKFKPIVRPMHIYIVNNDPQILLHLRKFIDEKLLYYRPDVKAETEEEEVAVEVKKEEKKEEEEEEVNNCVICLNKISNGKKLSLCGHEFCASCIDEYFRKYRKVCPICNRVYELVDGNQPDGTMTWKILNRTLPGFAAHVKTIEIVYSMPSGTQKSCHPRPGRPYAGTIRTAYLPDDDTGRRVLALLKKAFDHRLIFTIGQSRSNGADDVVTWNDIHHKTKTHGGPIQ
jgi:deltex-like protein